MATMQFNLRTLLVVQAAVAMSLGLLTTAWMPRADMLPVLISVLILAPLVGLGLAALARVRRARRWSFALLFSTVFGAAAGSFLAIQWEWHQTHPWPASDVLYVALSIVRGALGGLAVAYLMLAALRLAANGNSHDMPTDDPSKPSDWIPSRLVELRRPNRVALLSLVLALLLASWLPYWSFYRKGHLNLRLLAAIDAGDAPRAQALAKALGKVDKSGPLGNVVFLAMQSVDPQVRKAAIEAMASMRPADPETANSMFALFNQIQTVETDPGNLAAVNAGIQQVSLSIGSDFPDR